MKLFLNELFKRQKLVILLFALILGYGIYLAYSIRNLDDKINESAVIGKNIYNIVLTGLLTLIGSFATTDSEVVMTLVVAITSW